MSRNIDYSNNDSFKIDLMIPSIGKIDQGLALSSSARSSLDNVSTVNMQLPPPSSTTSSANSFESRSEEQAYYREDDSEK